jgi:cytosine/uracil/thiamine/allantoin permease
VAHLTRHLELFRALEFQNIQRKIGLPLPALISFFAGVGCVLATLLVGVIYSARNFADFQAIQLWRMEWLLGAVAAFVAGILLKKPSPDAQAPAASNPPGDVGPNRPLVIKPITSSSNR